MEYEVSDLGGNVFSIEMPHVCQLVWSICELVSVCAALNTAGYSPSNNWVKLIGEG